MYIDLVKNDKIVMGQGGFCMIELTRLNLTQFSINPELIEMVESTPDTVITLTTGRKLIVKETRQEVKNLVLLYKKEIYANLLKID